MFTCDPCNYKSKTLGNLKQHKTTKNHAIKTGEVYDDWLWYCPECEYGTNYNCKIQTHLNSRNHKRNTELPKKKFCCLCPYKSYDQNNFRRHLYSHRKRQTHMKHIIFKSIKKNGITRKKEEDIIYDKDRLRDKINAILIHCKNNNIDPNKHFNYQYYALNIDKLDLLEYNDFYQEIKYLLDL